MKNAIVFLADGFEEVEALSVVDYLRRAKLDVTTVKVPGVDASKRCKGWTPGILDSDRMPRMVVSSHHVPVIADETLEDFAAKCKKELPDCVYAPGGMPGSVNLAGNKEVLDIIRKCFDAGKIVSAICAAPALVLSKTGVLAGKKWTCFPGMESDADASGLQGSTHLTGVPFVTDGNVVTGRGAGCAEQLAIELIRLLADADTAKAVHDKSVQRDENGKVK